MATYKETQNLFVISLLFKDNARIFVPDSLLLSAWACQYEAEIKLWLKIFLMSPMTFGVPNKNKQNKQTLGARSVNEAGELKLMYSDV